VKRFAEECPFKPDIRITKSQSPLRNSSINTPVAFERLHLDSKKYQGNLMKLRTRNCSVYDKVNGQAFFRPKIIKNYTPTRTDKSPLKRLKHGRNISALFENKRLENFKQHLTKKEIAVLQDLFIMLDDDQDGKITLKEAKKKKEVAFVSETLKHLAAMIGETIKMDLIEFIQNIVKFNLKDKLITGVTKNRIPLSIEEIQPIQEVSILNDFEVSQGEMCDASFSKQDARPPHFSDNSTNNNSKSNEGKKRKRRPRANSSDPNILSGRELPHYVEIIKKKQQVIFNSAERKQA